MNPHYSSDEQPADCPRCHGSGCEPASNEVCQRCAGDTYDTGREAHDEAHRQQRQARAALKERAKRVYGAKRLREAYPHERDLTGLYLRLLGIPGFGLVELAADEVDAALGALEPYDPECRKLLREAA